jgi:hypothetical protein
VSSGVESFAVAGGQLVVGSASEFEFADAGWPHPEVDIEVSRDRAGTFEPVFVRKRQRRLSDVDAVAISLYAKGLTTGERSTLTSRRCAARRQAYARVSPRLVGPPGGAQSSGGSGWGRGAGCPSWGIMANVRGAGRDGR